jgi:ribose-phosphate pyrophosphokinase
MQLFALDGATPLALALARALGEPIAAHEDRAFDDGEHKWRPLADPAGAHCFVLSSLHAGSAGSAGGEPDSATSPHDKLVRLLMFAATLREHGAARVSAVLPYLAYARKDRQTKPFDPVAVRHVARLVEAVGIDEVVVLEAHNVAAFQNAFRVPSVHLESLRCSTRWPSAGPQPGRSPWPRPTPAA